MILYWGLSLIDVNMNCSVSPILLLIAGVMLTPFSSMPSVGDRKCQKYEPSGRCTLSYSFPCDSTIWPFTYWGRITGFCEISDDTMTMVSALHHQCLDQSKRKILFQQSFQLSSHFGRLMSRLEFGSNEQTTVSRCRSPSSGMAIGLQCKSINICAMGVAFPSASQVSLKDKRMMCLPDRSSGNLYVRR